MLDVRGLLEPAAQDDLFDTLLFLSRGRFAILLPALAPQLEQRLLGDRGLAQLLGRRRRGLTRFGGGGLRDPKLRAEPLGPRGERLPVDRQTVARDGAGQAGADVAELAPQP